MSRSYCKEARKTRFRDDIAAKLALMSLAKKSHRDKVPVRSYQCEHCRGYHLTSQPRRSKVSSH